jgi:hypothetical protein
LAGYKVIFPHLEKLMKSDSDSSSSGQKTKPLIDEKEYFNSLKETTFKIGFS